MALIPSFIPGGTELQSRITNFLEGGETGIDSIRAVEYGSTFLWTLDFTNVSGNVPLPKPFNSFFPAVDVSLNLGVSNTHTFDAGQTTIAFPRNTSYRTIDITFYDDSNGSMQKWMNDWIDVDLYNRGFFVSGLNDEHPVVFKANGKEGGSDAFGVARRVQPLRSIKLARLNGTRKETTVHHYNIYPDGPLTFIGSQSSEALQFQMRFNIYEDLKPSKESSGDAFSRITRIIGQTVGRFI